MHSEQDLNSHRVFPGALREVLGLKIFTGAALLQLNLSSERETIHSNIQQGESIIFCRSIVKVQTPETYFHTAITITRKEDFKVCSKVSGSSDLVGGLPIGSPYSI